MVTYGISQSIKDVAMIICDVKSCGVGVGETIYERCDTEEITVKKMKIFIWKYFINC